ncbi:hypothetical protein [Glutamicibacter mishrai]|uniref:hypothetical protein n=1 Tax=Glutamicibacter mishrai TaxID=1775880 RepID=UPI003F791315
MPGRFVRSKIAELVSEIISSRQGRAQLSSHGWAQGMPIVIAQPDEQLSDVMSLVAAHQPPVLVATTDPANGDLWFMYVSIGCTALQVVEPLPQDTSIGELYRTASRGSFLTFRIDQMPASSVVHAIAPQQVKHHTGYTTVEASIARTV